MTKAFLFVLRKKSFFSSLISSNIKMAITILMPIIHNIIDNDNNKADSNGSDIGNGITKAAKLPVM